jgi:lysophospholipase L1-like esterase
MMKTSTSLALAASISLCAAMPHYRRLTKAPAFFLAGDSTTAPNGGWGDCFLANNIANGSTGTNYGHSGTTTDSFRALGDWDDVISAATNATADYTPFITIQFGHNDQKSWDQEDFIDNLVTFVQEAKDAGATPLLLTSLTRRDFEDGVLDDNLENVRNATIQAADQSGAELVHLNEESAAFVEAIGEDNAYEYNLDGTDRTHLNDDGCYVFGALVAKLLLENNPTRSDYLTVDSELVEDLNFGVYYDP